MRLCLLGFFLLLVSVKSSALSLGEIEIFSHLNEPLQAKILINETENVSLSDLEVSLAKREHYPSKEAVAPSWLEKTSVKLKEEKSLYFIEILTAEKIADLYAHLLIDLKWHNHSLSKHFTLLFDPENPQLKNDKDKKIIELENQIKNLTKTNQEISYRYKSLKTQHESLLTQVVKTNPPKPSSITRKPTSFFTFPDIVIDLIENNPFSLILSFLQQQASRVCAH